MHNRKDDPAVFDCVTESTFKPVQKSLDKSRTFGRQIGGVAV